MNLHTPERQSDESQPEYRARRLAAQRAIDRMTLSGTSAPGKVGARQQHRDAMRESGRMSKQAGAYGRGLRNWINNETAKRTSARLGKRMDAL